MGGQFGAKKLDDGTGGTTPEHLQQYLGATYTNEDASPVMQGGIVTGRTDMRYDFTAGVGLVQTAYGAQVVMWDAGTTDLISTPASARTDVLWVNDFNGVHCSEGGTNVPSNAVIIAKKNLPAGAVSTANCTETFDRNWALPYGANLGILSSSYETWTEGQAAIKTPLDWGVQRFYIPTDRSVRVILWQTLMSVHDMTQPYTWNAFGAMEYKLYLDGTLMNTFEMPYDRRRDLVERSVILPRVKYGAHNLKFVRKFKWGADPIHFGGGVDKYQLGGAMVEDRGVAQ